MIGGSNRLTVLAGEITDTYARIRANAEQMAEQALDLGRKLIAAKAEVPHGSWAGWLEENTSISSRSASRYMQIAKSGMKSDTVADLGIRGAAAQLATSCRPRTQPAADPAYEAWAHQLHAVLWEIESRHPGARATLIRFLIQHGSGPLSAADLVAIEAAVKALSAKQDVAR